MKEIMMYGQIGQDVRPEEIRNEFEGAAGQDVVVRIHSPGGSVFDGLAMLAAMREHDGRVTAQVDGVAFSMAAVIALQADELTMHKDGWLMFHEAHVVAAGGAAELRTQVDLLETINAGLVLKLAESLGRNPDDVADELKDEIWLNGEDAADAGLARLLPERAMAAFLDPAEFKHLPAALQANYPTWCGVDSPKKVDDVTKPVTNDAENCKADGKEHIILAWG